MVSIPNIYLYGLTQFTIPTPLLGMNINKLKISAVAVCQLVVLEYVSTRNGYNYKICFALDTTEQIRLFNKSLLYKNVSD